MKNVVTPETARKLKEAGFKQQKPEVGQIWHNEFGSSIVVEANWVLIKAFRIAGYAKRDDYQLKPFLDNHVFAPTATDILRQLALAKPDSAFRNYLEFDALSNLYCATYEMEETCNENPAEAAALAWLEKYAK